MGWRELLDKAITAEGSQSAVAEKIGYSRSALCQVVAGTYPATDAIKGKILEIYGGKSMQQIPDGYMRNAIGHLVPIESIKDIDLARDEFVRSAIARAEKLRASLVAEKKRLEDDLSAFLELSAEKYGVDLGGERGDVQLTTFDGCYQVQRAVSELINFDERLLAAKELVDQCLRKWSKDAGPELRTIIESAFQVDKKGKINTKRILALRSLNIDDETWKRAMDAIGDAVTVVGSCTYYRLYERDDSGKYKQIILP